MTQPALDEMVDGAGGFRPHWRALMGTLASLGRDTLAERAVLLDRALADAMGDVPDAPGCDPIPLILTPAEFAGLATGLAQRATLIEAVLADVYGPQTLLARGLLPPALVHANPAFLRPCRDPEGMGGAGPHLHLYAADLLRGPDGAWRVVADRTARPAGLALALESRAQLARLLPELFRGRDLLRPRPFFDLWQDTLQRLAPDPGGNPAVAVLGGGPGSPHWAEDVVLARELSCALVEGGDLTVRDGRVFLKTLRGLSRVDVLLRRQDGRTIDPLELEPDPAQGVAGLLDAARSGSVRIVNDPGAGFAEAPALAAFLPGLAPHLLGETLRLPSATTVWLGDAAARARVGERLDPWLVRRALDGTVPAVRPAALSGDARAALARSILARPEDWVVAETLPASLAPCLAPCLTPDDGAEGAPLLTPCQVTLRLFLLFDGVRWQPLGGGLAQRLDPGIDAVLPGSGRQGPARRVKDVWVAAEDTAGIEGPRALATVILPIRRVPADLPSRAADNFFWLGRHLERVEAGARLLRLAATRLVRATPSPREGAALALLADMLARATLIDADAAAGPGTGPLSRAIAGAIRPTGPLAASMTEAGRLAGLLRDRLTGEMQAALGPVLRDQLAALPAGPALDQVGRTTGALLGFTATIAGLVAENMVRSGGRLFLDLGRRTERAAATATLLAAALHAPPSPAVARSAPPPGQPGRLEPGLRLMLELCDSVITYRARYLTLLQPAPVLDLVIADPGNPRSLTFQLTALRDMLQELEDTAGAPLAAAADALVREAASMVEAVAAAPHQAAAAAGLADRLDALATAVGAVSDRVSRTWFALLPAAQRLGLPQRTAPEPATRLRGAA